MKCYNCSTELAPTDLGRQDTCPSCGRDTHVCRNCEHYDPSFNNECKENQAERVVEKEKSNFCDWFRPHGGSGGTSASRDDLKSAAEALFGGGKSNSASSSEDSAKKAAEDLFKKKN